jgi:acyl-CoA synthetase (AMP-forming)/AMP-acid ligase II
MLDRYKDIVKTGGENVSSLRVEAVLVTTARRAIRSDRDVAAGKGAAPGMLVG